MSYDDDLGKLLSIKIAEIDDFESKFTSKIESAMQKHDQQQNLKRLQKCRDSIQQLEERISKSAASTGRIAKLFERMDELKEEEAQIMELLDEPPFSNAKKIVNETILNIISDDEEIDSVSYETTVILTPAASKTSVINEFSITDDFSNVDFASRIDEWLTCEKFSEWRQYRNLFVSRGLEEQVTFELTCFDIVVVADGAFRVPKCLWDELFEYQREGVEWMLKLWEDGFGGVLGDEMGLGKTVQVVSCLAALQISSKLNYSSLIIAPSTLLRQWIREFNTWWPPLRTVLLHSSSSAFNETKNAKSFLNGFYPKTHVFITSYGTCTSMNLQNVLLSQRWNIVVLDEGHKIRNPDAQVTLICKQLQITRRFVLSGTPIQNNLTELWSLFDFVRPGLLGSLPLFKVELALPINIGGYSNASHFQVQTSYKCACTLRDLIKPFLLRRLKRIVLMNNGNLPEKKEEIVFCRLTPYQRRLYEAFISSDEVDAIIERRRNLLAGIDVLRKICNHPELLSHINYSENEESEDDNDDEDNPCTLQQPITTDLMKCFNNLKGPTDPIEKSGKLKVLDKILELWHRQGHKVLIFCQTRQMLNLIEDFVRERYEYMRMDGTTPIKQRLQMVDTFNSPSSKYFIFLLTTRVGGLGINLTGADRVIIYDPDWNPSTDLQARERVYRLGQTRPVSILRLITAGTIEEKIYHRQIFKQFLTQRILEDPKQTRFFRAADLHDLFELAEDDTTETADMFEGLEEEITRKMSGTNKRKVPESEDEKANDTKYTKDAKNNKDTIGDEVLNDLLDMVGVHSTLPTTGITETIRPEYILIQKEAERIAQNALDALEKSRQEHDKQVNRSDHYSNRNEVDHFNQFKPTWTGKFGTNTKFGSTTSTSVDQDAADNITAQDILNAISERKNNSVPQCSGSLKLALDLIDYFNRVGGRVQSDRLAHAFKSQVQGSESAVVFRCLLKKVATFEKKTRAWTLNNNFMK